MYLKLLELKKRKKWLFYLLIIPFLILFILELYKKYLFNSAKSIIKETEEKDAELRNKQGQAEYGSEYHKNKAEEINKNIKNNKITEDWHLDE
jgi:hypothetical protein